MPKNSSASTAMPADKLKEDVMSGLNLSSVVALALRAFAVATAICSRPRTRISSGRDRHAPRAARPAQPGKSYSEVIQLAAVGHASLSWF
jgi:hypothetical protein